MKRLQKLLDERPELLSNEDVNLVAQEADQINDIKVLWQSDGGKQLVNLLITDALNNLGRLRGGYKTLSHIEMIALIASIDIYLNTAQLLMQSEEGSRVLDEELERIIREL